ncbi:MAG: heme biosynthesis protein HemY [Bdellovibrionales bacterium]
MRRLFFLVLKVTAVLAVVLWLADRPGTAHIVWGDYVVETSAALLAFAALGAGLAFYFLFRLWYILRNGPAMWRLRRKIGRLQDGQRHLTEGFVAVAGGSAVDAGYSAVKARKLLGVTPVTRLLQAQAAQLAGDAGAAREIFMALAADPQGAVLGYRGLIMEALRTGNSSEAEKLADKLRRLHPDTPWLNLVRFELAVRRQAWQDAAEALEQTADLRLMEPARAKQHRAALILAMAAREAMAGRHDQALPLAERAVHMAPGWLPAVIILAREQLAGSHKRAAQRTIERAWPAMAHPRLAAIYRMCGKADPLQAYRQMEQLCRNSENLPASRLALAEAALEADIWGEARRHLMALASRGEATQGVYRMLARLERRESGDEPAAMQWLSRAADAPPAPLWLCRKCGGGHAEWAAQCPHCQAFDALDWQVPGQSRKTGNGSPPLSWTD